MPRRNGQNLLLPLLVAAVVGPPDDKGMTVRELMTESKQGRSVVQVRLCALEAQGRLIRGFRREKDGNGRNIRVPVYRLKEETPIGQR